MNTWLVNLAFAAYLAALAAYCAAYLFVRPGWRRPAAGAVAAACLALTVFLALRWRETGHAPMSNQYESLLTMCWGATLLALLLWRRTPGTWLGPGTSVLGLAILATCALLDSAAAPLMPALRSNWLLLHVSVIMLGYGALALSFTAAAVVLAFHRREPKAEAALALDRFNERSMGLGYLLLTAGIVLGAVWANEAWGAYWSWDPKETWSLITWFVYTAALHLRRTHGWRGPRMAWLSVTGFAFVLFTYFGVNYLMSGLHSYAK